MIAIIPARGGSKGLPGKNLKPLLGKPLIAYSIEAAKKSRYITDIIVSTDSNEIYSLAMSYGCLEIGLRPSALAQDDSLSIDTYIHTLNLLSSNFGKHQKELVVLQPTSPLRLSDDIDNAVQLFQEKNADAVISFTEEQHPLMWHKKINDDLTISNLFENNLDPRQKIQKTFYPNGAIYVFTEKILNLRNYYTDKTFAYLMPRSRSVDIDTIEDFEFAQFLLERRNEK